MTEYEAERRLHHPAETVFAVVADLHRADDWGPGDLHVRSQDGDLTTVDKGGDEDGGTDDGDATGLARVRPEQLRVEWGVQGSPDYTGWIQVMHADEGHSRVVVHLSFLGDRPEAHPGPAADAVQRRLEEGLTRLAERLEA
ncbi:SRPBCC family protein [Pseudonocardia yuanmonensis]|uniref:SRPBCC family protein n=1 Tax=Pseudonocardia yuanmonensis TaxID=1095914 RepID=A0ABP8WWE6_9PSEU